MGLATPLMGDGGSEGDVVIVINHSLLPHVLPSSDTEVSQFSSDRGRAVDIDRLGEMEELSSQSDAERVLDSWKIFNITEKRIALDQQVSKSKPDETRTN
jgi:hypothetical protein